MPYRICKVFELETAHMLSKHPEKCKYPHGHSRKLEVVLSAEQLDANEMVCDFKALKLAVSKFIDSFDHAICVNSSDPLLPSLREIPGARLVVYQQKDPTTEVIARHMYDFIKEALATNLTLNDEQGRVYQVGNKVRLERVRLWETSTTWAEYSE